MKVNRLVTLLWEIPTDTPIVFKDKDGKRHVLTGLVIENSEVVLKFPTAE